MTTNGAIRGGKGNTIDAGTKVPLIVSWPGIIRKGKVYDGLIEFSDFFPTFAEINGDEADSDGLSFYQLLNGGEFKGRETAYVYYDPQWGKNVNQYRGQFARTNSYKLYGNQEFFYLEEDPLEMMPLFYNQLSDEKSIIKGKLSAVLEGKPALPEEKEAE